MIKLIVAFCISINFDNKERNEINNHFCNKQVQQFARITNYCEMCVRVCVKLSEKMIQQQHLLIIQFILAFDLLLLVVM